MQAPSQDLYRDLVEFAPDALILVDARGTIVYVRIPSDRGQGFQSNVDTDSSDTWTEFWRDRGHFCGVCRNSVHDAVPAW